MSARRFPCPIDFCNGRRHEHEIVCPRHWFGIPENVRRAIGRAMRDGADDAVAALTDEAMEFLQARRAS